MALYVRVGPTRSAQWAHCLRAALPEMPVIMWDEPFDPTAIRYAAVWRPEPGELSALRNLECIISIGAGVDHLMADNILPRGVPVLRLVSNDLRERMCGYVCLQVLRYHRQCDAFDIAQNAGEWLALSQPPAHECTVGLMGLGNMGAYCASRLAELGFAVTGWARSQKRLKGVTCFAGLEQLPAFLARTEIVVCMLPLTPETQNILNARTFSHLPMGAYVINVGRGEHVVDEDLLAALDSGRLSGACLDVFRNEPLSGAHPFWAHNKIRVTPHTAGLIEPTHGSVAIAQALASFRAGGRAQNAVDVERGY